LKHFMCQIFCNNWTFSDVKLIDYRATHSIQKQYIAVEYAYLINVPSTR